MARLIPTADPAAIELDPERRVAEALCAQFPKSVAIFHSYPWLRPERDLQRTVLREGEADFVVVHPRYGFLVIEVKGGRMTFDPATQQWDREGARHPVKDPFAQASRNMRVLEGQLKSRAFSEYRELPFARARCVVFPHCNYRGTLPPGAHECLLVTASELSTLCEKVEELFRLQPFVPKEALSAPVLDGILRALTSTFALVPALWSEIEDQERRLFRLTEDQISILEVLAARPRAAVQGVAGSGKTILALAKARAFADEGQRVLFLCFNEMLAGWQRARLPEAYRDSVTIRHYHKLCSEWVKAASLAWPRVVDEAAFFAHEAPTLLERAIDLLPERCFDAVVVDEGQDFQPTWWDTVELLNKRPTEGPLYVFFDPDQRIFNAALDAMPDLGAPFLLPVNCRNTERIAHRCGDILGKAIAVRAGAPEGRPPLLIHAPDAAEQRRAVGKQIAEWTAPKTGLKRDQIAIITRGRVEKSSLAGLSHVGGHPLTDDLETWRRGDALLMTNLHRFKGLEADALILVDVPHPDPEALDFGFGPRHFYVACSRAKHLLTVISLSAESA